MAIELPAKAKDLPIIDALEYVSLSTMIKYRISFYLSIDLNMENRTDKLIQMVCYCPKGYCWLD